MKRLTYGSSLVVFLALVIGLSGVFAETVGPTDFESFTLGSVNGQNGWSCAGSYDVAVVANSGAPATFGTKSLRISNAFTTGSFGDQTFSAPLANEAGELGGDAQPTSIPGTRQLHFGAQFDLAALANPEPMKLSVSPDNGSGARMSYLRFEDDLTNIHVFFSEVTGENAGFEVANFTDVEIATLDRGRHTFKFQIDFVNGQSNDVVRIYIDGGLVRTGTSWENYYRFDTESYNPTYPTRAINCLEFREGGTATPANSGNGFLIDNISLASGPHVFNGFFPPVNNNASNTTKAGSSIPVKFSLGGYQGLDIFAAGYPKSQIVVCDSGLLPDNIEETVTAGNSSLSYDPATDTYTYVWKTNKDWKNSCRQLVLVLNDGTQHTALFWFKQ
jgi:hypothetical protein